VELTEPQARLDDVPGTRLVGVEGEGLRQRLAFSPDTTTAAAVLAAVSARADVNDLAVEEPVIEEVVRRLYLSAGWSA
jgi:ABC-2 type transport system ATP-binding protein